MSKRLKATVCIATERGVPLPVMASGGERVGVGVSEKSPPAPRKVSTNNATQIYRPYIKSRMRRKGGCCTRPTEFALASQVQSGCGVLSSLVHIRSRKKSTTS
jgi:hypothetical protein